MARGGAYQRTARGPKKGSESGSAVLQGVLPASQGSQGPGAEGLSPGRRSGRWGCRSLCVGITPPAGSLTFSAQWNLWTPETARDGAPDQAQEAVGSLHCYLSAGGRGMQRL